MEEYPGQSLKHQEDYNISVDVITASIDHVHVTDVLKMMNAKNISENFHNARQSLLLQLDFYSIREVLNAFCNVP